MIAGTYRLCQGRTTNFVLTTTGQTAQGGLTGATAAKGPLPLLLPQRLQQVPLVAVQVFEDGDVPVGLAARGFQKMQATGL